jgi:thymidine kinase
MNLRIDANGFAVKQGAQIEVGGNERYVALCRRHYAEQMGWRHGAHIE